MMRAAARDLEGCILTCLAKDQLELSPREDSHRGFVRWNEDGAFVMEFAQCDALADGAGTSRCCCPMLSVVDDGIREDKGAALPRVGLDMYVGKPDQILCFE